MASRDDRGNGAMEPWKIGTEALAHWRLHGWDADKTAGVPASEALARKALWRSLRHGSIPRAVQVQAARPSASSMISVDGETVTLSQIWQQATRLASALIGRDVYPGEPAVLVSPNSIDFIRCYLALLRIGCPVILANPANTEAELTTQVKGTGARCVVSSENSRAAIGGVTQALGIRHSCIEELHSIGGGSKLPAMPRSDQVAIMAVTSGTTGTPKVVPLRHGDLLASIRGVMQAWRWRSTDAVVHALPLFHQHGLGALHAAALSGSSLYCFSRFDPEHLLDELDRRQATIVFAVPTMWAQLTGAVTHAIPQAVRLLVSGSAPLPSTVFDSITDKFGMMPIERYGTTESGLNLSNLYEGPRQSGSVGFALPGVETRVREGTGELEVRGPQVFAGYLGGSRELDDGWFATGDVVERDPATGAYSIVGRTRELIVSGGMNIYPREVENVLADHAGIESVAVVGVHSKQWGQEATAFFVSNEPVDEDSLRRFAKVRLSPYKVPKRLHRVPSLPVNVMGKIQRAELEKLGEVLNNPTPTT